MKDLPVITEHDRLVSPAVTPQALAWHQGELWFGSRDLKRIYRMDRKNWTVVEEIEAPGIPWAAVSVRDSLWFTIGVGDEDDRYLYRYVPGKGFAEGDRIACPDFTGSYLSHDGAHLYLSQWYKFRILRLDEKGGVTREIAVGAEICGHTFVGGRIHVLRGTEQNGGDWRLARLDPGTAKPEVEELARVPFQCRSLAWDGDRLWTNHREADRIVSFARPT
jgi:hypothetical protein